MSAPTLNEDWRGILSALKPGWDSYSAKSITPEALDALGSFGVVPSSDGGLVLCAFRDGIEFELAIGPEGAIEIVTFSPAASLKERQNI